MKVAILGPLDLEYMGGGETNSMMVGNIMSRAGSAVKYFGAGCPLENIPIDKIYPMIRFRYEPSAFSHDPMSNPAVLKGSSLLSLGLIGIVGLDRVMDYIEDYDVIYFSYPSLLARRIIPRAIREGKRVILANHGTFFEYFGNRKNPIFKVLKTLGEKIIIKPLSRYAGRITVHTQTSFQTTVYESMGIGQDSIVELPQNNVDFSEYKAGKPGGKFTVVFLGRIAKSKGVDLLAEVIHQNPEFRFRIIGNGPLLKKLMKLTHDTSAEIYGYTSDSEKKRILEESDLMIVPSLFDSLSIASIEGLASGLPLLVSETAEGPKYILGKNGIFGRILERDARSFSEQIRLYQSYRKKDPVAYYKDKLKRREIALSIFDVRKIEEALYKSFTSAVSPAEPKEEKLETPDFAYVRD